MQSGPDSKRWAHPSGNLAQFTQLQCIHVSKSLSLNKERELIGSHPRGSHGLHALESIGILCRGLSLLSQQTLSSL